MTDATRAAQDDLAFMRAVAEDRGALPSVLGAHLFAVGVLYGLNLIYAWAGLSGFVPWPENWQAWVYGPASAVYIPICIWLNIRAMRITWGPGARAFAATWSGVAITTIFVITVMTVAGLRKGLPYAEIWPALAFGLYGGAWTVMGIALRRPWHLFVAAGCGATAVACAALIDTHEHWLVMGIGLLLFLGLPGAAMMKQRNAS